jgi:hypothetical protein
MMLLARHDVKPVQFAAMRPAELLSGADGDHRWLEPAAYDVLSSLGIPVDLYGVSSYLLTGERNDFTAVVVCVKINGIMWYDMVTVELQARHHPNMQRVIY